MEDKIKFGFWSCRVVLIVGGRARSARPPTTISQTPDLSVNIYTLAQECLNFPEPANTYSPWSRDRKRICLTFFDTTFIISMTKTSWRCFYGSSVAEILR